jgi:hypothetical protein
MTSPSNSQTAPEHVVEAFARHAQAIAAKEHIPEPCLDYHVADSASLTDGATATLWVATAEAVRSTCYHVAVTAPNTQRTTGFGACTAPGEQLSLDRAGSIVVGSVGKNPAATVKLTTVHGSATVSVDTGYFLVPPALTPDRGVLHAAQMLGAAGQEIGHVTDLPAPGSAQPVS